MQAGQTRARGALQARGPVSGAPSAVQGQLGEAGSFGGLLLSCNGKHKKEDGNRTRRFCGWTGGGGRTFDASVPASPFLSLPSSQQPPCTGAWHLEACVLSLQLRGPWRTMCSVVGRICWGQKRVHFGEALCGGMAHRAWGCQDWPPGQGLAQRRQEGVSPRGGWHLPPLPGSASLALLRGLWFPGPHAPASGPRSRQGTDRDTQRSPLAGLVVPHCPNLRAMTNPPAPGHEGQDGAKKHPKDIVSFLQKL